MPLRIFFLTLLLVVNVFPIDPPIEPGVSLELAKWRAARYSDVRYKLNLTLEKMSPVLKGTMEIRVNVLALPRGTQFNGGLKSGEAGSEPIPPIILDWRKIRGHEEKSTISNISVNGVGVKNPPADAGGSAYETNEHLVFREGVVSGENVIKLDFTSPILTSGSAITRYVDKEDGSEYIYSLFVPSDASTAFPVFDQPDLKARFTLGASVPKSWKLIANSFAGVSVTVDGICGLPLNQRPISELLGVPPSSPTPTPSPMPQKPQIQTNEVPCEMSDIWTSEETKPISTYVFAFAAGPFEQVAGSVSSPTVKEGAARSVSNDAPSLTVGLQTRSGTTGGNLSGSEGVSSQSSKNTLPTGRVSASGPAGSTENVQPPATAGGTDKTADPPMSIYVRKSQAAKFKPHAAEVFRLNREAVKYFEEYFDYKFPFPKYDLVLIPEFPFGGMEHAGATFLREAGIIFPQEPTKNDHISRAVLIFHEAAHQWFGDTVTMRWFDDLWLKEGFANFAAYKAMERIMPEMNAWKVFYERVKQAAYQTDSTKGTTPIYQEIPNLSAAKSAYGNIVYNKAPAFLRQAEFYLGEDKFQTAVRAFLKKHEFGNAEWNDLVRELQAASDEDIRNFAGYWINHRGMDVILGLSRCRSRKNPDQSTSCAHTWTGSISGGMEPNDWVTNRSGELPVKPHEKLRMKFNTLLRSSNGSARVAKIEIGDFVYEREGPTFSFAAGEISGKKPTLVFPNYGDYGYGIFLLDNKSREYVLKNIQNEKDPFLRSMMWGALWDSVREGELDPREYVELVVKVLSGSASGDDESTTALLLNRVGTAMNYYIVTAGTQEPSPASAQGAETTVGERPADAARAGRLRSQGGGLHSRVEDVLIERMRNAPALGQRITFYRALLNVAESENARKVLKEMLRNSGIPAGTSGGTGGNPSGSEGASSPSKKNTLPTGRVSASDAKIPLKTKDKFDIVTRLLILGDPEAEKLLADLEKTETSDDAKRYAYAAKAGIGTAENKAKYWNDFVNNKEISESWIEAAFGPWNSIRHSELTLPYLDRALKELPNHKRNRKIFFVNGWLGAFIGGQRSEEALAIVNKFLADNPKLDRDLRLKILENADVIERAVRIRN